MRRSALLLASLALVLAVASPAFASLEGDEDKFFLSHKLDLHKKLFKIPTGATGPKPFFHGLFGRKMLTIATEDNEAHADFFSHQDKLDKIKKQLLATGAHADFFSHQDKLDKIKKHLATGAWKVHTDAEEIEADSILQHKLDKLENLLPTGAWSWDSDDEEEGSFFLPSHKLSALKKLLPTGHWKWDSDAQSLAPADEKAFLLPKIIEQKKIPTGTMTGPWWRH